MPGAIQVKRLPEDFLVEEQSQFPLGPGPYSVYTLAKRSIGTLEAVDLITRTWGLRPGDVQYGGMKDRHALTRQTITIRGGPRESLRRATVDLAYVGSAPHPFGPSDIEGNRFTIVLRRVEPGREPALEAALAEVARHHVPNYFDDQRFRSLGPSGEFVGRAWCAGDYERALWLALAEENRSDLSEESREKQTMREGWGRWAETKLRLGRSHRRSIVTYLADHPADFRGAFERVRVEHRRLWLSAFQSFLWNRVLAGLVRESTPAGDLLEIPHTFGALPVHRSLPDAARAGLEALKIPLPAARTRLPEGALRARIEGSLGELGLRLADLRVRHGRDAFFATANRPVLSRARGLAHTFEDDTLHAGCRALRLSFTLERGSYATILVKRITEARPC